MLVIYYIMQASCKYTYGQHMLRCSLQHALIEDYDLQMSENIVEKLALYTFYLCLQIYIPAIDFIFTK